MKRSMVILGFVLCVSIVLPLIAKESVTNQNNGNYLGSLQKGNYVWGGAMNLAWSELTDNILKGKMQFATTDKIVLSMMDKFNNPVFTKKDLDEKSYYIKSGYGQKTVKLINKESKKKFPKKSFSDLKMELQPTDIISYAYFLKEVQYVTVFEKKTVQFNGQSVEGFYAKKEKQHENVKIINYESDEKFIVSLQLKDKSDQLILAKGYDLSKPDAVVNEINKYNASNLSFIEDNDIFEAPALHLDCNRTYTELIGIPVANRGFESYTISQMFENIKFDMDEKGARVENEAVIVMTKSAIMPEKPKKFILDKPYWVIMKRTDSVNPYFILGVNNTELMKKATK